MKASEYQLAQQSYVSDGMARALALGNRGPLRFDQQGRVHEDILEAYWRTGFSVLENAWAPVLERAWLSSRSLDVQKAAVSTCRSSFGTKGCCEGHSECKGRSDC